MWEIRLLIGLLVVTWCRAQIIVPDINPLPYVFESDRLPQSDGTVNERYLPSVGNGHIATNVLTDTIFINGIYNGYLGACYRARVQSIHNSDFTVDNATSDSRRYALDVRRAVFEKTISTDLANVTYRVYAHHYYNRLLVTEVTVWRQAGVTGDITLTRINRAGNESADLNYGPIINYEGSDNLLYRYATIKVAETSTSEYTPINMYWTAMPDTLSLAADADVASWTFLVSLDQVNSTAETHFRQGLALVDAGEADTLLAQHTSAWEDVWAMGSIEIEGDLNLYKVVYGSLYYLYSNLPSHNTFTPSNQFYGLSPGGLANGKQGVDYYGHVFWDMETWMYPAILMLRPDLARQMLSYRINGMVPAFQRAASGGYQGTRFPWESAATGTEVTPDLCIPCRENQQHITGDIALAARQYLSTTRDTTWLTTRQSAANQYNGFDFILEMGRFWYSRPTYNAEKLKYEVNGIMPPDEYAESVNNSVYTNIGASYATHYARYAACVAGYDANTLVPDSWLNVVQNLVFPFQAEKRYHEEYEGFDAEYNNFTRIKQADVVLLGYPLLWTMPDDVRAKDLVLYESVTDNQGPAMTWGMHSIGWLDVGDKLQADENFNRSYQEYVRQPFKIWTEVQSGLGAVNFLTGMGGFLQTLVFGYSSMRLHVEELNFRAPAQLPPGVTRYTLRHVNYLGSVLDLTVRQGQMTVYVVSDNWAELPLVLSINNQTTWNLTTGLTITVYAPFRIYTTKPSNCPLPADKIEVDYTAVSSSFPSSKNIPRQPTKDIPSARKKHSSKS